MAVERVVDAFLDHLTVERGASVHTVAGYRRDLSRYAAFLAGRGITELSDAGRADVAAFAEHLRSGEGEHAALAASSVARALSAVKSLHRFAVDDGAVVDNAAAGVSPPQAGRRLPKALSLAQVQALLDSPDTTTPAGLRDAALLELLYGTGARISELTDLDVDDVSGLSADPEAGLRLFGKGRKERVVPVGSYARAAVDAWLVRGRPALLERAKASTPALFVNTRGARLSRQSAWALLREHAERAGITAEIGPHTLRHSFATHLLDGGADVRVVQELLGHASVATTQIYTLVTVEHLREVFLSSHPRAR
ncbi:site-specific tyrosine recombinase XerD [Micropruina sonneratiae]|uniref:site-specific tyrosine recombinase XerD n=1 Tax=Micropruina sonneratiae TaxID=2986940 RepID=UPI0022276479|nr:site-specific tyrosine recombinase XerD [Micropruina sp. KQZ13P-5]MCW3157966.1 site-specific tyrosine recombinase XerD [Micropruina sp. KQZ13P-5]